MLAYLKQKQLSSGTNGPNQLTVRTRIFSTYTRKDHIRQVSTINEFIPIWPILELIKFSSLNTDDTIFLSIRIAA